jgi:O-antigen chain-terminating methyltransferase
MQGDLQSWLDAAAGTDEDFVDRSWRLLVRRAPEPDARAAALAKLADGTLSRSGLVAQLASSDEFARVAVLDDAVAFAAGIRAQPRERVGPIRPRNLRAPAASDERAIEIPWCLARYDGESRVLDIGYAFAEPAYLTGLVALGASGLAGADLAEAQVPGLRPIVGDVRELPVDKGAFELVLCISTLEHVGRDNDVYAVDAPRDENGDAAALRELHRVLERGGRLLVSVPTGERDDQGWQLQRTPADWISVFERAGFVVYEDELYVRDDEGWHTASLAEASAARYRDDGAGAVLLAELHSASIGEKVRLAVRDVRYRDEPRRSTLG